MCKISRKKGKKREKKREEERRTKGEGGAPSSPGARTIPACTEPRRFRTRTRRCIKTIVLEQYVNVHCTCVVVGERVE
jgi:hypothetical protein